MFNVNSIKARLQFLGYKVSKADIAVLTFCIDKVRNTIRHDTNQPDVPEGLENIAVDMAVGEFLLSKKTFAPDDLIGFDFAYAVKQIQLGDTNTVFAVDGSLTPEQRLTAFINYLLTHGKSEFSAYRRLKW